MGFECWRSSKQNLKPGNTRAISDQESQRVKLNTVVYGLPSWSLKQSRADIKQKLNRVTFKLTREKFKRIYISCTRVNIYNSGCVDDLPH